METDLHAFKECMINPKEMQQFSVIGISVLHTSKQWCVNGSLQLDDRCQHLLAQN